MSNEVTRIETYGDRLNTYEMTEITTKYITNHKNKVSKRKLDEAFLRVSGFIKRIRESGDISIINIPNMDDNTIMALSEYFSTSYELHANPIIADAFEIGKKGRWNATVQTREEAADYMRKMVLLMKLSNGTFRFNKFITRTYLQGDLVIVDVPFDFDSVQVL